MSTPLPLDAVKAAIAPYLFWIKVGLIVVTLAGAFGTGWWVNGLRWEAKENKQLKDLQTKLEADKDDYLREQAKWEAVSQADAVKLTTLETQKDALLATINGLKLTRTVTVKTDAQGNCVADVLAADFRLRWNEVVSTAAATATADRRD